MAGSTGRARSGKRRAGDTTRIAVTLDFGDDDPVDLDVDITTFTYGELHQVRTVLAKLTARDEQGRVVLEPSLDERILVHAWVVLNRTRPMGWQEFFDQLPSSNGLTASAEPKERDGDDDPEGSGAGSDRGGRRSPTTSGSTRGTSSGSRRKS